MTQTHYAGQALEAAVRRPGLEGAALLEPNLRIQSERSFPRRTSISPAATAILCQYDRIQSELSFLSRTSISPAAPPPLYCVSMTTARLVHREKRTNT